MLTRRRCSTGKKPVLVIIFLENAREFPEIITSTGAKFWLRFCLSVLVLVIFSLRLRVTLAGDSAITGRRTNFAQPSSEHQTTMGSSIVIVVFPIRVSRKDPLEKASENQRGPNLRGPAEIP